MSSVIIKRNAYNYIPDEAGSPEITLRSDENVIKRWRIEYTVPQMVRLGLLPYSALEEYERQKALEEEEKKKAEKKAKEPKKNHTFWEDDDGDRKQLSAEEYRKFLEDNHIQL